MNTNEIKTAILAKANELKTLIDQLITKGLQEQTETIDTIDELVSEQINYITESMRALYSDKIQALQKEIDDYNAQQTETKQDS